MKKKKPPVVLASTLIVLVGLAVVLFPKNIDPNAPPEQPAPKTAEDVVPTGKSRSTPSKTDIMNQQKAAESKGAAMREGPDGGPQAALANAQSPTIFLPRYNVTKQEPNDASVQGQWYRPDARASKKEGFN